MPTIKNVSDKLIKILNYLELEPPYVLVGHSIGGLYVRGFAVYYPDLLAGLVIWDSFFTYFFVISKNTE